MTGNPFMLLTLIAGPAILTNAASILALNTGNRYGRAFDRAQEIGRDLEQAPRQEGQEGQERQGQQEPQEPGDVTHATRLRLLERLLVRGMLLLRAQTAFFVAIGLFVLSALVSLFGAGLSFAHPSIEPALVALGFGLGVLATTCLVQGCVFTIRETRLAMINLQEEQTLLLAHHAPPPAATPPTPPTVETGGRLPSEPSATAT
jgi:hypothetical protein